MDSVVIDMSMFIHQVLGEGMVDIICDREYGMGGFVVCIDHFLPPFLVSIEKQTDNGSYTIESQLSFCYV